ncbi:sialidase [Sporosarcina sp. GW1-11]|uniref:F510_1955 family glycosylhydrolase n=1 Tax=Sporosarcina sp. GW1-11 TaxID=2899126 RepID=UPI00294E7775|nr:sialidase [Sporosarcina sp. GW1-11]MDV6378673.1 sialidase [Sporosarcina sp. GW1-11]
MELKEKNIRGKMKYIVGLLTFTVMLSACNKETESYMFGEVKNDTFQHLHGLGYINGGPNLIISTHDGLYEYSKEGWKEANKEKHDYMGFQAVQDGFFSSGHPEPGSNYKNPLGLIKSVDRGASFEKLAFYGEIDFHYLAAGYDSNAIYVINEMPTNIMSRGLHYTVDEGATWEIAAMNGFDSEFISNIAAHPSLENVVAIGSKDGIFLSSDYGENFERISTDKMNLYTILTDRGGYYSSYENEKTTLTWFTTDNNQTTSIQIPDQAMNPIVFIAVNPENEKELVIATHSNDIYVTKDQGNTWDKLAKEGLLLK